MAGYRGRDPQVKLMRLYLSPIDEIRFKVIVEESPDDEDETESTLPFLDDRVNDARAENEYVDAYIDAKIRIENEKIPDSL